MHVAGPYSFFVFYTDPATTLIYTLSLHDALPISSTGGTCCKLPGRVGDSPLIGCGCYRSEEHTSELQSRFDIVCRLLLEKKKTACSLAHNQSWPALYGYFTWRCWGTRYAERPSSF